MTNQQITEEELDIIEDSYRRDIIHRLVDAYRAQREEIASLNSTCSSYELQLTRNANEIAMLRTRGVTEDEREVVKVRMPKFPQSYYSPVMINELFRIRTALRALAEGKRVEITEESV